MPSSSLASIPLHELEGEKMTAKQRLLQISQQLKALETELVLASTQLQDEEGFDGESLMIEALGEVQDRICQAFESCDGMIECFEDT